MAQFTPPFAANKDEVAANAAPVAETVAPVAAPAAAPVAAPAAQPAPVAAQPAPPAAPAVDGAEVAAPKKKRTVNRQATRQINKDDINFVCANVPTMSYADMAEKRGLTRHQVNRILMDTKKALRDSFKDGEGNVTDEAKQAKIEEYIMTKLSRPEDSKVGAKKGSPVRDAMNDVVSDILSSL